MIIYLLASQHVRITSPSPDGVSVMTLTIKKHPADYWCTGRGSSICRSWSLPINNEGSPQRPLTETFGKLHQLLPKGNLFVTTQAVFEQSRDDLAYADTDAAEQHREISVFLT